MEILKCTLLVILFSIQYILNIIFRSDIPMNIDSGDIICIIVNSLFIQIIIIFSNKNYKSIFIWVLIFALIWVIDTIHLISFTGEKDYVLNVIGIYTIIISLLHCIDKFRRSKLQRG